MPYGITTRKTTSNHSRISVVIHVHGLGLGMITLKSRTTNGTVDSLKNEENKKDLFSFLSEGIVKEDLGGKLLLSTKCERVLSNRLCDVSALEPCNHSEADTRIFLHLAHASGQGHHTEYVRTVDSDIVVLAIRFFPTLGLVELWVGFGSGKKLRDIPIHDICSDLGPSRSVALPLFHAITGCLHHTSLAVARRRLGHLGKIHQYSLKDCWH